MLRTTNEHFKPKALLEPEAGPARKKPRFRPALSWPLLQALCATVQVRPFMPGLVIKRSLDIDKRNGECLHMTHMCVICAGPYISLLLHFVNARDHSERHFYLRLNIIWWKEG